MEIKYIIIVLLALFPLFYKYSFWMYWIQDKEYRWDKLKCYIVTPQWKKALFNIWFFIEVPVFLLSFWVFLNPSIEIVVRNVTVSFLILYNIFAFWKILRKKIILPKITSRMIFSIAILIFVISCDIAWVVLLTENYIWIYSYILSLLVFAPLIFLICIFLTLPIVNSLKNKKINKAILKTENMNTPITIGITGSYGKSSVKEYLSCILEKHWKTLKTPENKNTELSVASLVLNKLNTSYKYFVAEMWAYRIWEINTLWKIANHKHWFLSAIWSQHIWLFWWIENTKKAKAEIANSVAKNNGNLYLNWENEHIRSIDFSKNKNIIKYWNATWTNVTYTIEEKKENITYFYIEYRWKTYHFNTKLCWEHNILNLCWVISCCIDLKIPIKTIQKWVEKLQSPPNTTEIITTKNHTLINDSYNLPENGVYAAIKLFDNYKKKNKILVMDDIYELGKYSKEIHKNMAIKIHKSEKINHYILIWKNYAKDFEKGLIEAWCGKEKILNSIKNIPKNSVILFEGRNSKKYFDYIIKNDTN